MRSDRIQNPLRALAAELALLAPEDVDAILLELAEDQRARLRGLLADHDAAEYPSPRQGDLSGSMFSPWLAERVSGAGAASSALTDHSRRTLLKLAAELSPPQERKTRHATATASPGLFKRLIGAESWR